MSDRKLFNELGFGRNLQLFVALLIPIVLIIMGYRIFSRISDFGPIKYIPTSTIAAQRCRDKFSAFKSNDYVRQITLTEIEINSAIQEDIQKGSKHVAKTWVNLDHDKFTLEGVWSIVDLSTSEQEVSALELKSKGESIWRMRLKFKMTGKLKVADAELRIISPQITLGSFELPGFVVSFLKKVKPGLFTYSILPQIKHVWLKKEAIELIKD